MLRLIVEYALTHDAAGELIFRDNELEDIVGISIADNGEDLDSLIRECEFRFYTRGEMIEAKSALQAAGFDVRSN